MPLVHRCRLSSVAAAPVCLVVPFPPPWPRRSGNPFLPSRSPRTSSRSRSLSIVMMSRSLCKMRSEGLL